MAVLLLSEKGAILNKKIARIIKPIKSAGCVGKGNYPKLTVTRQLVTCQSRKMLGILPKKTLSSRVL